METFDYQAISESGKRINGSIAATTAREARDMLRAQNLNLLDVFPAKKQKSKSVLSRQKVRHKDRTLATRQLAILLDAATPVDEALKVTALQFGTSAMRAVLLDVRTGVIEGRRLSVAMKTHPKVFSDLYCSMVASAETSGQLPAVFERLATDMESAMKMRQKIIGATVYPAILMIVAFIVVTILMVAVVPKVVVQFESFGQDLPPLTKGVIAISDWMKDFGIVAALVVFICLIGLLRLYKNSAFRYRIHKIILSLPFIGSLVRNVNAARFSRTMAGLIDSGTPPLPAMETANHTLKNRVMNSASKIASQRVKEGMPMSQAIRQSDIFPPIVAHMINGGERSGKLGLMFSKSADYLESEFESATTIFMNLLEPVIIIFLSLIVLLIIGAIFLPILQLNTLAF